MRLALVARAPRRPVSVHAIAPPQPRRVHPRRRTGTAGGGEAAARGVAPAVAVRLTADHIARRGKRTAARDARASRVGERPNDVARR